MTITFCALCVCAGMQDLQYTFNVPSLRAKSFAGAALISLARLAAPGQASPVWATVPASAAAAGLAPATCSRRPRGDRDLRLRVQSGMLTHDCWGLRSRKLMTG